MWKAGEFYMKKALRTRARTRAHTHTHTHTHTQTPRLYFFSVRTMSFPCDSAGKGSACNAGDLSSIPGLGRSPGEGKGYPLQYSGLENSTDCTVDGIAKSRIRLSDWHLCINYVEKLGFAILTFRKWFSEFQKENGKFNYIYMAKVM